MKHFISAKDVDNPVALAKQALTIKRDPLTQRALGENRVLGLIFFNSSLRTRMSTIRAAYNLGMRVITLNVTNDSWQLETELGVVMDQDKAEHISEAIPVMSSYCDILGVRSFPGLQDRQRDYQDHVMQNFTKYSTCPVINLESATVHPVQSLTDVMTILETVSAPKKIVLTWAPHVKALPQSVPNSFCEWMIKSGLPLTIAHPEKTDLCKDFTHGATICHDQNEALQDADIVYVKNWSSFSNYGQVQNNPDWMVTLEKLKQTRNARLMHCLPVRRNVVISDDAMDSDHCIVQHQAHNRLFAAQVVLSNLLTSMNDG